MERYGALLLTGGGGFIGRNLREYLQNMRYPVLCPGSRELDLTDKRQVEEYLDVHKVRVAIHCANTRPDATDPYVILDHNLRMFFNLVSFSEKLDKVIYFGSGAEYGRYVLPPLVREDQFGRVIPSDPYGFAKYIMCKTALSSKNIYDLCCFGVYGKYEVWERRFISNNIVRLLRGGPMNLRQDAMFDYLYIDDLCRIVEWFIEHTPQHHHYNVCTSQPIALSAIAKIIRDCAEVDTELLVEKTGWQNEYSGDNSRLLKEMGNFHFTELKTGVKELLAYYRKAVSFNSDCFQL